jgi:hypothetical protein
MKPKPVDMKMEAIRAALLALYESHGGVLAPQQVVDAARDPSNALHEEFEWDDENAAESYRLAQAGMLIRRIRLSVIKVDQGTKQLVATVTRQFQSRPSQRGGEGGYETVQDIMADDAKREELIAQVLREMGSYRKRYSELVELQSVWAAIDDASESLEKGGIKKRKAGTARAPAS